jgi:hypothetical protein
MKIITLSTFLVVLLIAPVHAQNKSPLITNPYTNRVSGTIAVTPGYQKSYYDAHPEERALDDATQANKPIDGIGTQEQGNEKESHKDYSSPPSPPPPTPSSRIGVRGGVIDGQTGDFYPQTKGGVVNPRTGEFLPDVGKGYIDPKTGEFIPKK